MGVLEKDLNKFNFMGYELPTGTGKSFIIRAVQRSLRTDVLTASNNLVNQYIKDYEVTAVKGRKHYTSPQDYHNARKSVLDGADGIFNPLSYFYFRKANPEYRPDCIIVDEAHKLSEIVHHLSNLTIDVPTGKALALLNKATITEWDALECLQARLKALSGLIKFCSDITDTAQMLDQFNHIAGIATAIQESPQDFTFKIEKNPRRVVLSFHLEVSSVRTPKSLLRGLLDADKVLLISGTYPEPLFLEAAPDESKMYRQFPSPIDIGRRPVFADFVSEEDRDSVSKLVERIESILDKTGHKNTVIPVSYALAKQLHKKMSTNTIFHTKKDKNKQLKMFKENGGVLLACGMAEGIDLPGELCETIIIPSLLYPNRGDDFVQRRVGQPDGAEWYGLTTLLTTIQQIGRGCRGPDDYCETFILDYLFGVLISQFRRYIDASFFDSIIWTGSK